MENFFEESEDRKMMVPFSYLAIAIAALLVQKYGDGEMMDSSTLEDKREVFVYMPDAGVEPITVTVGPAYDIDFSDGSFVWESMK